MTPDSVQYERYDRFVREYWKDCNATAAYVRTHPGVDRNTAKVKASRLLALPYVRDKIAKMREERIHLDDVTHERIRLELARVALADPRKLVKRQEARLPTGEIVPYDAQVPLSEMDDDTAAAVQEVSTTPTGTRVKLHNKMSALELLGKMTGALPLNTGRHSVPGQAHATDHDAASEDEIMMMLEEGDLDDGPGEDVIDMDPGNEET